MQHKYVEVIKHIFFYIIAFQIILDKVSNFIIQKLNEKLVLP